MSFVEMSLAGAAMILVIALIRALAINRVPKRTFPVLWGAGAYAAAHPVLSALRAECL